MTLQELIWHVSGNPSAWVDSYQIGDKIYYVNNYPNPRIRYLAHHAGKNRIRKKNLTRVMKMIFGRKYKYVGRIVDGLDIKYQGYCPRI